MSEIKTGTAPSVNVVGEAANTTIGKSTSRQTFADTLASNAVRGISVVGSGATAIGSAVAGALGNNPMMQVMQRASAATQQMSVSGGSGPVSFSGPTAMGPSSGMGSTGGAAMTAGNGLGGATSGMTGSAAALPSANSGQAAFGAGASALPGGDMSGGAIGGASAAGGGMGSNSAIGAAAGGGGQDQLLNATKQMQETQMSFNLQYLQLQSQMQSENRSYTAVSNIMKTKHDTVKNSISNIR